METVNREQRTKQRKITLHKCQILHDIDVLSYKLAETSVTGEAQDNVASDSEDMLDGAMLKLLLESCEASMRKKIGFCLEDTEILEVDNATELEADYVYNLRLPASFKDTELRTAAKVMHDYLVMSTLMEWYTHIGTNFGSALGEKVIRLESRVADIFRKPGFVSHPQMAYCPSYRTR